jgi:hypothetical protein
MNHLEEACQRLLSDLHTVPITNYARASLTWILRRIRWIRSGSN